VYLERRTWETLRNQIRAWENGESDLVWDDTEVVSRASTEEPDDIVAFSQTDVDAADIAGLVGAMV